VAAADLERELRDLQRHERAVVDKLEELEARDLVASLDERRGVLGSLLDETRSELATVRARITHTQQIAVAMEAAEAASRAEARERMPSLMALYSKEKAELEERIQDLADRRARVYSLANEINGLGLGARVKRPARITIGGRGTNDYGGGDVAVEWFPN
jgi:chromosome segregation ATPase